MRKTPVIYNMWKTVIFASRFKIQKVRNLDLVTMNLLHGKLVRFCSLYYFFERKKLWQEDLKTKNH